jgi:hypothetical protein
MSEREIQFIDRTGKTYSAMVVGDRGSQAYPPTVHPYTIIGDFVCDIMGVSSCEPEIFFDTVKDIKIVGLYLSSLELEVCRLPMNAIDVFRLFEYLEVVDPPSQGRLVRYLKDLLPNLKTLVLKVDKLDSELKSYIETPEFANRVNVVMSR